MSPERSLFQFTYEKTQMECRRAAAALSLGSYSRKKKNKLDESMTPQPPPTPSSSEQVMRIFTVKRPIVLAIHHK